MFWDGVEIKISIQSLLSLFIIHLPFAFVFISHFTIIFVDDDNDDDDWCQDDMTVEFHDLVILSKYQICDHLINS